jgi:putative endonuclease
MARHLAKSGRFHYGRSFALCPGMLKQFVYVLKNSESPSKYYTGLTSDPQRRLAEHNQGSCIHTTKHGPWSVDVIIKFSDERRAIAFERYLKSGSGVAFAKRHLR